MTLSDKQIVAGLRIATYDIFKTNVNGLSVRSVRDKVKADLGLDNDFFTQDEWKSKSKQLIKDYAEQLIEAGSNAEEPEPEPKALPKPSPKQKAIAVPVKQNKKRASQEEKPRPRKKQKKEETLPSEPSEEEFSDVSSLEQSAQNSAFGDSESDAPKPKKRIQAKDKAKMPAKREHKKRAKIDESDEEDEDQSDLLSSVQASESDASPPPKKSRTNTKTPKKKSAVVSESEDDEQSPRVRSLVLQVKSPSKGVEVSENRAVTNDSKSDSEMSVVLDEGPSLKKKRRSKSEMKAPKATTKAGKTKTSKAQPKELSPDETTIKTLQQQLRKCGVNKIWQFELKQYGVNNKAKIFHLQKALKDVGLTGRFSEQRAREIKELRELQADLEAVTTGEMAWGLGSGRRSRSKASKNFKESTDSEDKEEADQDGGGAGKKDIRSDQSESEAPVEKKRNPRAALVVFSEDEDSD